MPPSPPSLPRIPAPPPPPALATAGSSQTSRRDRAKTAEDTDPGIGDTSPPKSLKTLRPQPQPQRPAASLLSTQVGIGAVRLDPATGKPVFEKSGIAAMSLARFAVRPGAKLGELVLTALGDHEMAPAGFAIVTLQPTSVEDARAIDALGRP
jgi:hypothetical protein